MSKRRITPCACKPVWHDNLYGRDQATGNSSWRRQEIAAELLGSYSLQTRLLQDNKTWRLMVHGPRTPSLNGCTDAFYGRVQGTVIEALRFRVVAATGSPCTYEATWWPRYAGQYSVNVWLTYANNSAMLSPEEFAPVLSHLRDRLKPALGKLKAIDRSLKDNPALLLNDRDRAYGAVLQQVPGSPWSVHASAKARLERGRQILEPWCAPGQFDGSGAWVSVRACESDDSCAAQGHPYKAVAANHSLHMQYLHVWKPHGCRLRQFVDAPAFEAALQERAAAHGPEDATRTAKCNQSTDSTRWRVLLAGDSLMREEYCALRQFLLDGRRFGELLHAADCFHGDNATVRTAHLIVSFVGINGFYDSFFGWHDLPGRTEQQINVVLQAADRLRPHVLIWLDGAHSMELNSITDFLATLNTTARLFAQRAQRQAAPAAGHRLVRHEHRPRAAARELTRQDALGVLPVARSSSCRRSRLRLILPRHLGANEGLHDHGAQRLPRASLRADADPAQPAPEQAWQVCLSLQLQLKGTTGDLLHVGENGESAWEFGVYVLTGALDG